MTANHISIDHRLRDSDLLRRAAFVGGEWIAVRGDSGFPVVNPSTGEVLATLPSLDDSDTREAVAIAQAALGPWRSRTALERSLLLRRWADLIRESADDVATILTAEQGKPWPEARDEVVYSAAFLDWFAEEGRRVYGDVIPSSSADARIIVIKQPVGVTAGITPWNLPAAMVTRKVAPALAAGCTIVLKPAEQTPLTALALAELSIRAGVPEGVLNVVTTGTPAAVGLELTTNPAVRKVSFTGSTEVGKLLMSQASGSLKKLSLELGGNSPFIVFDDGDIDHAVTGIVSTKFRNGGQICTAANRIFVQEGVRDAFTKALHRRAEKVEVGDGFASGIEMGPLIDDAGIDKVERHVADLVDRGGTVLVGGSRHELGRTFYQPTVISGLARDALPWREETFGPVAAISTFGDEKEALELANDTQYGLVAYIYTHDVGRIWRVSEALETGMVAVNTGRVSNEMAPFGGIKQSGLGREGSKYGIDDWLELKYINMAGLSR